MPYIGKSPEMGVRTRYYYTVSSGATSVSGSDDNSKSLIFSDGEFVDVSLNGVALVAGTDYNTTTANTIAGLSAMSANDVVEVIVYDVFSVFSGDISGDLAVGGSLAVNSIIQTTTSDGDMVLKGNDGGSTITALTLDMSDAGKAIFNAGATFSSSVLVTTADNSAQLNLTSTDADASNGPRLVLQRDSGSPADNDVLGQIEWYGENDASEAIEQAKITVTAIDVTDGTEDSALNIATKVNSSTRSRIYMPPTETVFNEESADIDFRIESDNVSHALFVKGSDGNVGLGCSAESMVDKELVVNGPIGAETEIKIRTEGGVNCSIFTAEPTSTHDFGIKTNGVERFRIANNGDLTATDTSISSNSDERLKKDITDYTYDLATFKKYSAKKFNWKQPQYHGDRTNQIGFIAQDLKDIDLQWVSTSKVCSANLEEVLYIEADSDIPEGKKVGDVRTEKLSEHPEAQYLDEDLSVFTSKLGQIDAMYISIIQQLITKIEALETKVKALEDA